MKTAKRVLAVIVAVIMIVGTCAVAASAAGTLQARIDAAAPGDTVKLPAAYTIETVTVNKDITIDLDGGALRGLEGQPAIKITKGNVIVTNGQVLSRFPEMASAEMLQRVFTSSPPAIRITGGTLTVDGCRIVGGMVRVPTTPVNDPLLIPSGSGIQSYNGATVTLKRTSIYGDYGVNNAVRENPAGGTVIIEDALIAAYTKAVKGVYEMKNGSEEIIAADRIAGVLNSGIRMEPDEKQLVKNFFDERVIIITKKADTLITELGLDEPTITVTEGKSTADVDADEIEYLWPNTKGTDCSYKLVPESVKLSDGSEAPLDAVDAAKVDTENKDAQKLRYRVEFQMSDKAKPFAEMLLKEGLENPLDGCLGWAGEQLDEYYAKFTAKNSNNSVDSYDEIVEKFADLLYMLDEVGSKSLGDQRIDDMNEYKTLRQKLYVLAGAKAYNNSDDRKASQIEDTGVFTPFGQDAYEAVFGAGTYVAGWKGTLDRIDDLKNQLETKNGGSFTKTNKWGDLVLWAVETVYPELIGENANSPSILNDLIDQLKDLDTLLQGEMYQAILNEMGASSYVNLISKGIASAEEIAGYVRNAQTAGGDIQATIDYVLDNKDKIKGYVDKAVDVIENWRTYVTPAKFIDGDFAKTYSTLGSLDPEYIGKKSNLHIAIAGAGMVTYNGGTVTSATTDEDTDVQFVDSFTLTAEIETGDEYTEFLFWVNEENGIYQIVSTEPSFTMETSIDRDILAVFGDSREPVAYFTNTSGGQLCGIGDVIDGYVYYAEDIESPALAAYTFTGWPAAADSDNDDYAGKLSIAARDNTAYFAGDSAFAAPGAYYGPDGAILRIRPEECSSYIVTPTYSVNGEITITVLDNGKSGTATGKFTDVVRWNSELGSNAYWRDASSKKTVCVTSDLYYMILNSAATVESVAGPCPDEYVFNTAVANDGEYVSFYVARSTSTPFKTTGIVWSYENSMPTIGGENCKTSTTNDNSLNGVFTPIWYASTLATKTVYVRAYIEFADGRIEYSDDVWTN